MREPGHGRRWTSNPEVAEVGGRRESLEVAVGRARGFGVAGTVGEFEALISNSTLQEVEELGVLVFVWVSFVSRLGGVEHDEVALGAPQNLARGLVALASRDRFGVVRGGDVPSVERGA
jgi:hypothetical protein